MNPWPSGHSPGSLARSLALLALALLTCTEWSVYPFFSHAAITMKERPAFRLSEVGPVSAQGPAFPP
jgi:hypothetical protein